MAQKIKKQFFKILPLSVVGLMVFAMAVGVWQGQKAQQAEAAAGSITLATVSSALTLTVDNATATIANIGDTVTITATTTNTDGNGDATPETTITADFSALGCGAAIALVGDGLEGATPEVWTASCVIAAGAVQVGAGTFVVSVTYSDIDDPAFSEDSTVLAEAVDNQAPTFASVALGADEMINVTDAAGINISVTTTGVEDGQTVSCTITDTGAGSVGPVTNTTTSNATTIATGSLAGLVDGVLTATCNVSDVAGNPAVAGIDTAIKETLAPIVATYTPADNSTTAAPTTNLVLTFVESIYIGTGNVVIKKASDNSTVETIDITGGLVTNVPANRITINPNSDLLYNTAYYVQYDAGILEDVNGNDIAGITDTTSWSFTTTSKVYLDTDSDGIVDTVRLILPGATTGVDQCTYEAGDWTVTVAGTIHVTAVTGITNEATCATDEYIDVEITSDNGTGGSTAPAIRYSNLGTAGSVQVDGGALGLTTFSSIIDGAAPVAMSAYYMNSLGTTVDTISVDFSEAVSWNLNDLNQFNINNQDLTALDDDTIPDSASAGGSSIILTPSVGGLLTGVSGGTEPTIAFTPSLTLANRIMDSVGIEAAAFPAPISMLDYATPYVSNVDTLEIDGSYGVGQVIDIDVSYTESVMVSGGVPTLALNSTGTAVYSLGSGASSLTFSYTVAALEASADLDYSTTGDLALNGSTIDDAMAAPADNTLPAVGTFAAAHAIVIETVAPTLTYSAVYSDNAFDTTLAGIGKYVIVEFTPSEPLMSQSVNFNNPAFGVIPSVDDGTGCDTTASDNIWTSCAPVTGTPPDTNGLADFTIDITDLAYNPASIASGTLGSSVTVDTTAPSLTRVTAKTQGGAFPFSHDSVLWYNYTGDTFEAYVEGDTNLSEIRVCIKSLTGIDPTAICDDTDFAIVANYLSSGAIAAANNYTFTGTTFAALAGANPLVDMTGYSMNVWIADEAGNIYISPLPADAFVMVWNVEPSVLDPVLANATTTSWAGIADFTNVVGLTFQAENAGDLLGSLSFPGSIDLTDPATVTALQSFSTNVVVRGGDAADGTVDIAVNATAIAALDVAADLTIALPAGTASQPGLVVYNDAGVACDYIPDNVALANDICSDVTKDISLIAFNAEVVGVSPPTITFSTTNFSGFGADSSAPTVATFNPLDAATGVATTATVSITFSEPVDTTSFTYTLTNSTGVTWSAGDTIATISHTAFSYSTPYTLTVTAVTDKVGNAVVGTPSATFTTAAQSLGGSGGYTTPADTTPPTSTSISINSGAVETASQSVTLTLGATDATQMMLANSADFSGANWETYVISKTWLLTGGVGEKTVYAKFQDAAGNISASVSDTINSTATTEIPTDNIGLILQDPAPAAALPEGVNIGTLVKRADMSSVYFIDQDNRRHAFPNEAVYLSYYSDFSGIQIISSSVMAAIPLGSNVTMRPGTYLVKIQSDPKVYAVSPYGVLKWVNSEQIAVSLYGATWATRVVDVEPTFFINYQIGPSITTAIHPTGSAFSYLGDSKVYYVDGGVKKYISTNVFIINKFQNKFIIRDIATSITYPDGADLPAQGMDQIMTLR